MVIDASLVRSLLREQFPQWADATVQPLVPGGWDNRSFRIGSELVARLPSDVAYAGQVDREARALARLATHLTLPIPKLVAVGRPGCGYPWSWSILGWIEGTPPSRYHARIAMQLGTFLASLHAIEAADGPPPSPHNFHRGASLDVYSAEVRRALVILEGRVDERAALRAWNDALATRWAGSQVWIHGDVSPGNLLERDGRLVGVIDFGNAATGDPACDLAIAWSWFDPEAAAAFRSTLELDEATWLRGRAWALWKALVVAAGISPTNAVEYHDPLAVVAKCLSPEK